MFANMLLAWLPGHAFECFLGHSVYMRVHGAHVLSTVRLYDVIVVDVQLLVWINGHQNNS